MLLSRTTWSLLSSWSSPCFSSRFFILGIFIAFLSNKLLRFECPISISYLPSSPTPPTSSATTGLKNRPKLIRNELRYSGIICIHRNHLTPFLNATLRRIMADSAGEEVKIISDVDDLTKFDWNLFIVIKQRSYETLRELEIEFLTHSFHSIRRIETEKFVIISRTASQEFPLRFAASTFSETEPLKDYTDVHSLIAWYNDIDSKRKILTPTREYSSKLEWTSFNRTHVFNSQSDVVDPVPMDRRTLDLIREAITNEFERGWYQFIPGEGLKVAIVTPDGQMIQGFRQLADEPITIKMPFVTESATIHWITPIYPNTSSKIVQELSRDAINAKFNVKRHLVRFDGGDQQTSNKKGSRSTFNHLPNDRNLSSMFQILEFLLPNFTFEDLLFYSDDPKAPMTEDFLNRIRLNAVPEKQIFSPIPFVSRKKFRKGGSVFDGIFDSQNWNYVAFYRRDYEAMKSSLQTRTNQNIHVLRASEPDLIVRYGDKQVRFLGKRSHLTKLILDYYDSSTLSTSTSPRSL